MEEEKNNNNNNNLSENQENILKQEIKFIQEEFKNKIKEHKNLKDELKKVKNLFHNGLNDYTAEKNTTIEKEREIESLLSKISKMKKMMILSINQTINTKFYIHLLEISYNKEKETTLLNIFNFLFNIYNYCKVYKDEKDIYINNDNDFESITNNNENEELKVFLNINKNLNKCQTIKDLLTIIRNETEIKNILLYSYDIFKYLQQDNIDLYINIKNAFFELFNEINSIKKQYPFDFLFDFMKNIFSIIDSEKQVEDLKELLNKLVQEKNAKFLEVKNIESIIKTYNRNTKIISNYIKALKNFYFRIKEHNKNNQDIDNKNNNKNNNSVMKELIDDIEKFKKITIDYDKLNSNFDAMTSLSFGTNLTLSEKSSIKSSMIDSNNNNEGNDKESNNIGNNNNNNEIKNNNNELCLNLVQNNSKNVVEIKDNNNEKKKNIITKIQKNSVENKILNRSKKLNGNNSYIEKKISKTMKKNISLSKHNIDNVTITENNINKTQIKPQLNKKSSFCNNKKRHLINKSHISYTKDTKNNNKNILNKSKINGKKIIPKTINAHKILNKDIRKRFNSNIKNNTFNLIKDKNISKVLKSALNINKAKISEPKKYNINLNKNKLKNNNKNKYNTEKEQMKNESQIEIDKNGSPQQANTLKLFSSSGKKTDNEYDNNTQFILSQNQKNEFKNNNRYNISKKIDQLKKKESEELFEITMPNKDNNLKEDYFETNLKDSICDEMISNNFGTANSLIRSTTNDYINRLGFKNNVLWSENLYKNKALKFKSNFKKLNIEKPIDGSSCCAACT